MPDPMIFFALLVDTADRAPASVRLELEPGTSPPLAAEALAAAFAAYPADRVAVTVGGERIGVAHRDRFAGAPDRIPPRQFGSGDQAALPGLSRRFVLLRFRCRVCDQTALRVHADGAPPDCPEHGEMGPVR